MFLYGLQHVLSMYAGVVAVPLIIGTALKLSPTDITYLVSAGLFMSGVATLLQTLGVWKIGARQPIVQGTSFAAVSTMLAIGAAHGGGTRRAAGHLRRAVAGRSGRLPDRAGLHPAAAVLPRGRDRHGDHHHRRLPAPGRHPLGRRRHPGVTPTFGAPKNIALAAITMVIIVLIYRFLPAFLSRVAILLGLVLGTVVAIPFGLTNFSRDRRRLGLPADLTVPLRPAHLRGRRHHLDVRRDAGDHDRDDRRHPGHR